MIADSQAYTVIEAANSPSFSPGRRIPFHLRGAGLAQVWALNLGDGAV
jgi:hypothetical protein